MGMNIVLILANGTSSRFGRDKLSVQISEKNISVLEKTVSAFDAHPEISEIFIVGRTQEEASEKYTKYSKFSGYISGGLTRYESFCAGISEISGKLGEIKVLVHNAANPFVSASEISEVLSEISQKNKNCAVGVGRKVTNTLRMWNKKSDHKFSGCIPRENMYAMETPQGAYLEDFEKWIELEKSKKIPKKNPEKITDELMLAERNSGNILILPASPENIKITYMSDLQNIQNSEHSENSKQSKFPITGFGVDSHRFEENKNPEISECRLCGVVIKNTPKFSGNSDADVALHAICNAILSGLGKNSFSRIADTLCQKGEKNSAVYLQKILEIMSTAETGRDAKKILHLVVSFEGKRPKIEKYFPQFRTKLSALLHIPENSIGLNATTGEELDGVGRGEGMKVLAVVTMI